MLQRPSLGCDALASCPTPPCLCQVSALVESRYNAVERVLAYSQLEQEAPEEIPEARPPKVGESHKGEKGRGEGHRLPGWVGP